jgi:hypothetical protein
MFVLYTNLQFYSDQSLLPFSTSFSKKTVFSGWKSPHPRRFTPTPSSEFRRLHTQKNEPRLPRGQQLLFELAIKLS